MDLSDCRKEPKDSEVYRQDLKEGKERPYGSLSLNVTERTRSPAYVLTEQQRRSKILLSFPSDAAENEIEARSCMFHKLVE